MIGIEKATKDRAPLIDEANGERIEYMLPEERIAAELAHAVKEIQTTINEVGVNIQNKKAAICVRQRIKDNLRPKALGAYCRLIQLSEFRDHPEIQELHDLVLTDEIKKETIEYAHDFLQGTFDVTGATVRGMELYYALTCIPEFQNDQQVVALNTYILQDRVIQPALAFVHSLFKDNFDDSNAAWLLEICYILMQFPELQNNSAVTNLKNEMLIPSIIRPATVKTQQRLADTSVNAEAAFGLALPTYHALVGLAKATSEEARLARERHDASTKTAAPPELSQL